MVEDVKNNPNPQKISLHDQKNNYQQEAAEELSKAQKSLQRDYAKYQQNNNQNNNQYYKQKNNQNNNQYQQELANEFLNEDDGAKYNLNRNSKSNKNKPTQRS